MILRLSFYSTFSLYYDMFYNFILLNVWMQPKQELTEEAREISTGMKELLSMVPGGTSQCLLSEEA